MKTVKSYATIEIKDGLPAIVIQGRQTFLNQVNDFLMNGAKKILVEMTVKRIDPERTDKQMGYYFGVVVPYARTGFKALGWQLDLKQTDDELRKRFYSEEIPNTVTGEMLTFVKSLQRTKSSKEDLMEYIDRVIQFCAEDLDIIVPPPPEKENEKQI